MAHGVIGGRNDRGVCGVCALIPLSTLSRSSGWNVTSRLKTPANRDGVIPGEAAAAVLVQKTADTGNGYGR